jgi:hypothetical protein
VLTFGGEHVNVACVDSTGNPVDSTFSITFIQKTTLLGVPRIRSGYILNNAPASSYVDSDVWSYNGTDKPINVDHLGTGEYEVTFHGFGVIGGFVQLTAAQTTADRCEIRAFGLTQAGQELIKVNCFNRAGRLIDVRFTLQFAI